jgi:hypothetical protein
MRNKEAWWRVIVETSAIASVQCSNPGPRPGEDGFALGGFNLQLLRLGLLRDVDQRLAAEASALRFYRRIENLISHPVAPQDRQ